MPAGTFGRIKDVKGLWGWNVLRRSPWSVALATVLGGVALYRALCKRCGQERTDVVPEESSVTSMANDWTGWAPESGEPGETRAGYGRGECSSVAGDDLGLAPESGERFVDTPTAEAAPVCERIEELADEDDRVMESSEESFPASDAPSWTSGRA